MSRLPSHTALADMTAGNRWSTLDAFASDRRSEVEVAATARHRHDARRKLRRVYEAADHFGDFVGQPDREEA